MLSVFNGIPWARKRWRWKVMNELIVYKISLQWWLWKRKKPDGTDFCRHTNHRVNANSSMSLAAFDLKLFFLAPLKKILEVHPLFWWSFAGGTCSNPKVMIKKGDCCEIRRAPEPLSSLADIFGGREWYFLVKILQFLQSNFLSQIYGKAKGYDIDIRYT